MKKRLHLPTALLGRALAMASIGAFIVLGQTGCVSLFDRSKNNNAWIDEDTQTTRRDRYAAQNNTDSGAGPGTGNLPDPNPAPAAPLSPVREVDPTPAAAPTPPARVAVTPAQPANEGLRLPTLESDFPQPERPPVVSTPDPAPPLIVEEEGYTPLQPKLPKLESIEPPSE